MESFRTSYSAISNAITCPWKYYVYNVTKAKTSVESIAKVQGILVHQAIEDFYGSEFKDNTSKRKDQVSWLMEHRDELWGKRFTKRSLELVAEYEDEYAEAVEDTISYQKNVLGKSCKAPTWTAYWKRTHGEYFNALEREKFAECYERLRHIRFDKTLLEVYATTTRCLENFITLSRRMQQAELHIEFKPEHNVVRFDVPFTGRIDRLAIMPDGSIHVHDFKTGRKEWSETDVANSDQLMSYAVMVLEHFGRLPSVVGIVDLYNNEVVERTVCQNDIDRFHKRCQGNLTYTRELHREIVQEGIDKACNTRPIPAGIGGKMGCPCDLIYEADGSAVKCPFYERVFERGEDETN